MLYLDTSALVKRYITEPTSEAFDDLFEASAPCAISRLSFVEVRCALARRRRNREISAKLEKEALECFQYDIQSGALVVYPISDREFFQAHALIEQLADLPLRTLDALHLAAATQISATGFATADRTQAAAAAALALPVHNFATVTQP